MKLIKKILKAFKKYFVNDKFDAVDFEGNEYKLTKTKELKKINKKDKSESKK